MIAPNFKGDNLRKAADQVVSHIRYTQHLAMMDNKFDNNKPLWFKGRWVIRFVKDINNGTTNCNGISSPNVWTYMIYSNKNFACPGGICDNNPNLDEFAKNPLNPNQILTGGYSKLVCADNNYNSPDKQSMKTMRLADEYGVTNVVFGGGCRSTTMFISFDNIGRPFNSFPKYNPYEVSPAGYPRLIKSRCTITLSNSDDNITIAVEPETGYTHIL